MHVCPNINYDHIIYNLSTRFDLMLIFYYRTCTAHINSVLCRRCYKGTNHDGHNVMAIVNNNANSWCDCGDLDCWKLRLNCKYHSPNMSESAQCGAKLAIGETYYKCKYVL